MELNRALQQLLRRAFRNGVDVRGGHRLRNGDDLPDWEVEVVTIEKRSEGVRQER